MRSRGSERPDFSFHILLFLFTIFTHIARDGEGECIILFDRKSTNEYINRNLYFFGNKKSDIFVHNL